ncbi:MAG TPA: CBS domain-containing protein [Mycobacteriales bacterium]|jgi:CBS domain-containing protein|nr:CBS domain-containing protein [Mycobacteriales bacterium]
MKISDVVRNKGSAVATLSPDSTVTVLLERLAEHGVGAMVVQAPDGSVSGIVSERDVVRQLRERGAQLLGISVDQIMTRNVTTCAPGDAIEDVMRLMTDRRLRHVPVMQDGALAGIVSIGDLVKSRIDDLVSTTAHLEHYIAGS